VALIDTASVPLDAKQGNHFRLRANGNRTVSVPTDPTDGQRILVEHVAVGAARTLTLTTGSAGAFAFGATITGLVQTASGRTDVIECVYSAAAARWLVVAYNRGF
jgi:hypothetical protein